MSAFLTTRPKILWGFPAGILVTLCLIASLSASEDARIFSIAATADPRLTADPDSPFWKTIPETLSNRDSMGNVALKNLMTIRSRWTRDNLYLLFSCAFESLYVKPDPEIAAETNGLWKWDVAEAFIGDDFENINRYKEFEVSPQGEWVDLDIDRGKPGGNPDGWRWNSGLKTKARIDDAKKIWFAEMCIPFVSISRNRAESGLRLRINFYRTQGQAPNRTVLAWQPTHASSFHVPSAFGIIQLVPRGN